MMVKIGINSFPEFPWGMERCSSNLADVYLIMFENNQNLKPDHKFFRYIDDILVITFNSSDNGISFGFNPNTLFLKCSFNLINISYLYINIKIKDRHIYLLQFMICNILVPM